LINRNTKLSMLRRYFIPAVSLVLGSLQSLITSNKVKEHINYFNIPSDSAINENLEINTLKSAYRNRHAHMLVEQAFKDAGFKGRIFFDINMVHGSNKMGTAEIYGLNSRAVFVGTSQQTLTESSDEEIHAMAAHEAFHSKHRHALIRNIAGVYLYLRLPVVFFNAPKKLLNPFIKDSTKRKLIFKAPLYSLSFVSAILSFEIAENLYDLIQKLCEVDADLSASIQLGVTQHLIDIFKKIAKEEQQQKRIFNDYKTHPQALTRIKYLSFVQQIPKLSKESSLFKSDTYSKILEERKELESKGIKKDISRDKIGYKVSR